MGGIISPHLAPYPSSTQCACLIHGVCLHLLGVGTHLGGVTPFCMVISPLMLHIYYHVSAY